MMRVVKHDDVPQTFEGARMLEKQAATEKARDLYEILLKSSSDNLKILDRLIIIYRKLKQPKKEISAINREIKILSQHHSINKKFDNKVQAISKKLNLMLNHTDRKGNNLLIPPQIIKLEKRKKQLEKI